MLCVGEYVIFYAILQHFNERKRIYYPTETGLIRKRTVWNEMDWKGVGEVNLEEVQQPVVGCCAFVAKKFNNL